MSVNAIFRIVLVAITFVFAGCAQLPSNGVNEPVIKNLGACGVSVQFSGQPEQLATSSLNTVVTKAIGSYGKWESSGWRYSKYRLVEFAICACRDYPYTATEFEKQATALGLKTLYLDGIGQAALLESNESVEEKNCEQWVQLKNAPRCMLMQGVTSPESVNAADAFFPTLTLMTKPK